MERELFDWTYWDHAGDEGYYIFYPVTLKQQIGDYPVGTKFYGAKLLYSEGFLSFYDENGDDIARFKIKLQVVEQLD